MKPLTIAEAPFVKVAAQAPDLPLVDRLATALQPLLMETNSPETTRAITYSLACTVQGFLHEHRSPLVVCPTTFAVTTLRDPSSLLVYVRQHDVVEELRSLGERLVGFRLNTRREPERVADVLATGWVFVSKDAEA